MSPIREPLAPDALSRLIERHCLAYYVLLGQLPGCELHRSPAVTWFASGLPIDMFNGALGATWSTADADRGIAATLEHFRRRGLPMLWHIGPSVQPADAAERLLTHGCAHVEDEPGMAADLANLPLDEATPPELRLVAVQDAALLRVWMGVWGVDAPPAMLDLAAALYSRAGFAPDRPLRHVMAYLGERPVGCAAIFEALGVASVQHVVTLPELRRRGYGAALTRHVMREAAARGYRYVVLTASSDGLGIYRRLGFRAYNVMRTYELAHET